MEIELADAVQALRDELIEAAARANTAGVGFVVGPIELEFAVELKADAKLKTKFKAWVVSADVEAGVSRGRTHRVKVTLTPESAEGGDVRVSGNTARRAGQGAELNRIED
ncbi:trypco2 family protein [Actinokineospora soli]|uniref:Trypco2 family protein n=1 Tax=Actinokineospora soli TaxID=1048753 RepID=A0ABW2TSY7_9PSEU